MKVTVCEKCGHPLPEMEVLLDLTRMQQRLFVTLQRAGRAGIGTDDLMKCIYANKDAPASANILTVMKVSIQPKLQKHGMKLTVRRGPNAIWRLESI